VSLDDNSYLMIKMDFSLDLDMIVFDLNFVRIWLWLEASWIDFNNSFIFKK